MFFFQLSRYLELLLDVLGIAGGLAVNVVFFVCVNECVCVCSSFCSSASQVCLQVVNALGFWPALGKMRSFMAARSGMMSIWHQ